MVLDLNSGWERFCTCLTCILYWSSGCDFVLSRRRPGFDSRIENGFSFVWLSCWSEQTHRYFLYWSSGRISSSRHNSVDRSSRVKVAHLSTAHLSAMIAVTQIGTHHVHPGARKLVAAQTADLIAAAMATRKATLTPGKRHTSLIGPSIAFPRRFKSSSS